MLHNSLLIRDLLRATNNNPLHRARRDPHRLVASSARPHPQPGDLHLAGEWALVADPALPGSAELAADLSDFLGRMGVRLDDAAVRAVRLSRAEALAPGTFRLSVQPNRVEIAAPDAAGLWAGGVWLEREMMERRGPYLPQGDITRAPEWPVQISQAPWGANYLVPDLSPEYLSDDAFRLLAHYGLTGMTLYGDWLCYVKSNILPELDAPDYAQNIAMLRDASERASRYGISFYYVAVSPKLGEEHPAFRRCPGVRGALQETGATGKRLYCLCSSDSTSLAFHAEVMGNLFREVPLLGGLILIVGGESYYHCYMRPALGGLPPGQRRTNCPVCAQRDAEEVVAGLLGVTADAVHAVKPGAPVVAWPYSAQRWSADPQQLQWIACLPPGVTLQSEIDKDHLLQKEGYRKPIWDYSVDFTGPSDRILAQAKAARAHGVPLYIKHETALGLELIHVPYVPALPRLAQKWRNVAGLQPAGVLQSWMFFGMWGSRAEELGWWTRWRPEVAPDDALARIAARDFGPAAGAARAAWEEMSAAIGHIPAIPIYFTGPWFLGPAHPLLPEPTAPLPRVFQGLLYYLQESEEAFSNARLAILESLVMTRLPARPPIQCELDDAGAWQIYLSELERSAQHGETAYRMLAKQPLAQQEREGLDPTEQAQLAEETTLVEFLYRTFVTALHTVRWLRTEDAGERREIARAEIENARAARPLYAAAPWLDLALRRDGGYPSSIEMLEEKIRILEEYLRIPNS